MNHTTQSTQRPYTVVGAARVRIASFRPSTMWSIGTPATSPKTCAHVATKDFGGNATLHPRPEEAPL